MKKDNLGKNKRKKILLLILLLVCISALITYAFRNKAILAENVYVKLIEYGHPIAAQEILHLSSVPHYRERVLETMLLKCPEKIGAKMINASININYIGKSGIPLVYLAASGGQDMLVKKFVRLKAKLNYSVTNQSLLELASKKNDLKAARILLKNGASPNIISHRGMPFVYAMMLRKKYAFVKLLAEFGADLKYRSPYGRTMLDQAQKADNKEMIDYLVQKGVRPYNYFHSDNRIFDLLEGGGPTSPTNELEKLLKAGQSPYILDGNRNSPLDIAAYSGNLPAVKILLKYGEDANYPDGEPLISAIKHNQYAIAKELLNNGADPNLREDSRFKTPLHYAVCVNLPLVKLLMAHGSIVNLGGTPKYVTPLVLAKKCPKTGSAEYLESVGASDEVGDAWMKELTPFSLAAAKGDSTTVKKMISAGYPVNKTDKFHNTALHYAARSGNTEMMQLLLKHGAKINFQGEEYYTPLLYAAWRGPISSCRYLIKKGCDLRAQGLGDVSALNLATERNSVELVKFFLKHGIKVNNGRGGWTGTPLHSAADFNSYEAAKLLIENGADVNAENEHGWTPLIEAAYSESREVAKLLLEHGADVDHKGHDGTSARGIGPMSAWLIEFQYLLKNPHGEKIRASFDCEKADSIVDRIICRDKLLATLDVQLFNKRLAEEHSPDKGLTKKEAVLQKQKIWRGSLHDKCRIQGHIFPEDKKFMEVRHCLEVIYQLKLL